MKVKKNGVVQVVNNGIQLAAFLSSGWEKVGAVEVKPEENTEKVSTIKIAGKQKAVKEELVERKSRFVPAGSN